VRQAERAGKSGIVSDAMVSIPGRAASLSG
jgi:hypothetical protein